MLPHPGAQMPSAFAAFASHLRSPLIPTQHNLANILQSPHFQSLLHSQVAALQSHQQSMMTDAPAKSPRTPSSYCLPRKRVGGSTMKTAKVWRFFDELPSQEQAAECRLCRKKIKATNSSTTGMIRHLRSCHVVEYQQVQEARQSTLLMKMEEKAKVQLLRDIGSDPMARHKKPEATEAQKSPSASSSASDTASSTGSSLFVPVVPSDSSYLAHPAPLPAPKPLKILSVKTEHTEVEESSTEQEQPTDLSYPKPSAFAAIMKREVVPEEVVERPVEDDDTKRLNAQIALMIVMDQHSPLLVDRPGFRQLIRFLRPSHQLPFSSTFQAELIPEIMMQIRQFGAMMMMNNPILNPFDSLVGVLPPSSVENNSSFHNSSFRSENSKSESPKRDDDSDSASSADSESALSAKVETLSRHFGYAVQQDELVSLVTVCHSVFSYFEDRPSLLSSLGLSLPPLSPSLPSLLRELRFVSAHSETINAFIRSTPDMELIPVSEGQARMLRTLVGDIAN